MPETKSNNYLAATPQLASGIYQWARAEKELKKLHSQAVPEYGETAEQRASRMRAEELAKGGFTEAERANFRAQVAQDISTQGQRALDVGGAGLGRAVNAIGNINMTGAENRFAAQDAALHRENIHYADRFSAELQRLADQNVAEHLKQRYMAEQALGQASQDGRMNTANASSVMLGGLLNNMSKTKTDKQVNTSDATRTAAPTMNASTPSSYDWMTPKTNYAAPVQKTYETADQSNSSPLPNQQTFYPPYVYEQTEQQKWLNDINSGLYKS